MTDISIMHGLKHLAVDERLPNLPTAANAEAMREIFQRELPDFAAGGHQILGVSIKQFDHRPGHKVEALYMLHYREGQAGAMKRLILFSLILPADIAAAQYEAARERRYARPALGPALQFFPELGMLLFGFPNDPRMKGLSRVFDEAALAEILRAHWERLRVNADYALQSSDTEIVKYVPQDRCTLKHTLALRKNGHAEELVLFSKTYGKKTAGRPIYEVMSALWNAPVCQSGDLIVPEPLFYERDLNAIFQRGLPGAHAIDLLDRIDLNEVAAQSGAALAGLQQSAVPTGNFRARQGELAEFEDGMRVLLRYEASYDARLERMYEELWQRLPGLTPLASVPTHGAFRLPQLLLVENKIALLDFDGFMAGDPMMDAGSFIAHLFYLVVKGELELAPGRAAIASFVQAYEARAPWGLPRDVLQWFVAVTLIAKQAKKCVKLAKENHAVKVGQLAAFAEAVLRGEESLG